MRRFLLDDIRTIDYIDVTCRTPQDAYIVLEKEWFDVYMFDHDLGEVKPGTTGYDVLKWALTYNHLNPKASIFLVTNNPVGREQMKNLLKDFGYYNKGIEYVKG